MTGKKKLIIAISAVALVVIAAIISVVAVLAAQQVSLKSTISITYTAAGIDGGVSAKYKIGSSETSIGSKTLSRQDANIATPATLGTANITLTQTDNEVLFTFVFTNTGAKYQVTMSVPSVTAEANNLVCTITKPSSGVESGASDTVFVVSAGTTADPTTATYQVKYKIVTNTKDAKLNSSDFGIAMVLA